MNDIGRGLARLLREYLGLLLFLLGMFAFRSAYADWYHIPSESMEPTIMVGDRVVVSKHAYAWRVPFTDVRLLERAAPAVGEVITFASPHDGMRLIKRIVAVAGDRIEARRGVLYLNDVAVGAAGRIEFGAFQVPHGHVFAMGDNRDHSFDSRFFGPVPIGRISGRASVVAFSFDGWLPRADRWGVPIAPGP
jgi:signal peptidase I